jgi:hypothetical protein
LTGSDSYLGSSEEIETYLESISAPPVSESCACGGPVMTNEKDFSAAEDSYFVSWSSEHDTPAEYAVYGWVKQSEIIEGTEAQLLFRFTTNTEDMLGDADTLGDRSLMLYATSDSIVASTYSYDIQGTSLQKSLEETVQI